MLGKDLSEALGGIAEDKIEAAANVAPANRRPVWVRVAACAAVLALLIGAMLFWPGETRTEDGKIIEAPGILKAYGCELDEVDEAQLADYALIGQSDVVFDNIWSPFFGATLAHRGITFSFLIDEELDNHEITFDVSTNCGELHGSTKKDYPLLGKTTTIQNGDVVYWRGYEVLEAEGATLDEKIANCGGVYLDIVIKADGNVIGYAVFEIGAGRSMVFTSSLKASVYFPKVDGEFQTVTDEYVNQQIANAKAA